MSARLILTAILVIHLAFGPLRLPAAEPITPDGITVRHNLSYREGTSRQWKLDLAMKTNDGLGSRPAIVVIHGGGWLEGDKSSFASREHGVPGNIVDFADRGFVAVTINYRLSGEAPFPAALDDCKSAVRWLSRMHANTGSIPSGSARLAIRPAAIWRSCWG